MKIIGAGVDARSKCSTFAIKINEKEEKMKADSITSPIRKQGFRASMTVKW